MTLAPDHEIEALYGRLEPVAPAPAPLVANKAKLEAIVGETLPPELFAVQPWGHRMLVVRQEAMRVTAGGIHLPPGTLKPLARGWVLSVGHTVGTGRPGARGFCPFPRELLLGTEIVFAKYAGENLKLFDTDDEFNSRWVLLTDDDIWFHIGSPPAESIAERS